MDDLPAYIRSLKPENVLGAIDTAAKRWGFPPNTVKAWYYGERFPKRDNALQIVAREKGRVTMETIYGGRQ